jgi:hypothetical protein
MWCYENPKEAAVKIDRLTEACSVNAILHAEVLKERDELRAKHTLQMMRIEGLEQMQADEHTRAEKAEAKLEQEVSEEIIGWVLELPDGHKTMFWQQHELKVFADLPNVKRYAVVKAAPIPAAQAATSETARWVRDEREWIGAAQAVPEGYWLASMEPTAEMMQSGTNKPTAGMTYRAMRDAAIAAQKGEVK